MWETLGYGILLQDSQGYELVVAGDKTGRLLKYSHSTKQVEVLLQGLGGASGVALSEDGSYLLVAELTASRIQKYWLKGPKAHTADILLNLTGIPNKIKRIDETGQFWIAMANPSPRQLLGVRIEGEEGAVPETISFSSLFNASGISEVHQHNGKLYLRSLSEGFVGFYHLENMGVNEMELGSLFGYY